jgi:hypothetical protein
MARRDNETTQFRFPLPRGLCRNFNRKLKPAEASRSCGLLVKAHGRGKEGHAGRKSNRSAALQKAKGPVQKNPVEKRSNDKEPNQWQAQKVQSKKCRLGANKASGKEGLNGKESNQWQVQKAQSKKCRLAADESIG